MMEWASIKALLLGAFITGWAYRQWIKYNTCQVHEIVAVKKLITYEEFSELWKP